LFSYFADRIVNLNNNQLCFPKDNGVYLGIIENCDGNMHARVNYESIKIVEAPKSMEYRTKKKYRKY
jgi:hypothetical protein